MKRIITSAAIMVILFVITAAAAAGDTMEKRFLMRFPDVYKDTVVFVYGGDIWKAPTSGGTAMRLTLNDGEELFPKFSPDGQMIAFSGQYDGNVDVYVMNTDGGNITRVTYHPGDDVVVGWHPIKKKIIFSSARDSYSRFDRLYLISPDGTGLERLILNEATQGSFSPDGTKIAYNKVRREHRTWKRYQGGLAQEVYMYDLTTNTEENLTNFKGTDRIPMWVGDTIYFSSDRNYTLNIYAYDTKTKETKQMTFHDNYDVRRPSCGTNQIVYELGGELWLLDIASSKTRKIAVDIRADAPELRPYIKNVKDFLAGGDISPTGKRALITARGEVFTVPQKDGPTRNLTNDSGARDKDAAWSPDGKTIAYLSDKSGEYEIYLIDPMGKTEAIKLTEHKDGYRHTLRWSPDSKKIAFADQTLRCYYVDITTKKITEVDKSYYENVDVSMDVKLIYDFSWSPDSRYLAYSKMDADWVNKLYIYSLETGKSQCVSNGLFNEFHPVFSKCGEYLFFVSNRRFSPTLCDFEWEMVYKDMAGIYCMTLKKDGKRFLEFLSDEEEVEQKEKSAEKKEGKEEKKKDVRVTIDFDGIAERVEALPLPRSNYRYLSVSDKALFYLNGEKGDYNRFEFRGPGEQDLFAFDFEERKPRTVIKGVNGYKLSFDGSHIIYAKGNDMGIIKADAKDSSGEALDLSGLKMYLEPLKEWMQIYNEAWRLERDYYYDPRMKGIDWQAIGEKYRVLVPHASCREDMRFLIGEMIGELNTSHTYVFGGDHKRRAERVNTGMLGVDWEIDAANKHYKFKKIYLVPDWSRGIIPPLYGPGILVNEGDYLIAVNGVPVTTDKNVYSYFQDMAGKQVTLTVNTKPTTVGAKTFTVKPAGNEGIIRYQDWVEHNRLTVEKASNGEIGYLHFPDTYLGSATEFPKYFYSQLGKKGLIVDGRYNGGGLDPDIFFHRLARKPLSYWTRRYSHDQVTPTIASERYMVCLTNRQAGSGGDEFPMLFRKKGMGPVIGTRTWGGLVGVSMFIQMIDGGGLTAPDYRIYDNDGKWIVENLGVEPDITVDLHPAEMARGYDAQLMKGVEILMKKIKEDPKPWPKHDAWPVDKKK